MKIIYQADDGVEFYSETECRNYERSRKIYNAISERKVRLLTRDLEVIRGGEFLSYRELKTLMGIIYYFRCSDKKVLEMLSEFFGEDFEENVTYYFDERNDEWTKLDNYIYNCQYFLNDLLDARAIIMDGVTT